MGDARRGGRVALAAAILLGGGAAPALVGGALAGASPRHLLARSDFPKGWSVSPTVGSGAGEPVPPRDIAACTGVRPGVIPSRVDRRTSPEFDQTATDRSVDEEVATYPTKAGARAAFEVLASSRAPACAAAYLNRAGGPEKQRYTVSRLSFGLPATRVSALAISLTITAQGATVSDVIDDVVVVVGRSVATVTFTSVGSAFPHALAEGLAASAARRIG